MFVVSICFLILSLVNKPETVIFKLSFIVIIAIGVFFALAFLLKNSGFFDKIQSVNEFQEYIKSFGGFAVVVFVLIQFLQVVLLPLPSFLTIGVGVLLFGPLKCAVYSFIGIFIGSMVAHFVGKFFGVKIVRWVIGEKTLNKIVKMMEGKSELLLSIMFLFPFFPDDALCFVSGIVAVDSKFYFYMVLFTRLVTVFLSAFSINNSLIPYDTWWGILLWGLFFLFAIFVVFAVYKWSDKIKTILNKCSK
ncbi:MAG: TVP38/TMEM64 family protein [Clostridia bacterium]|nr:TVP38/TMEM64 family protein [Clostridia bacterium]